jgi:hypothetical protein
LRWLLFLGSPLSRKSQVVWIMAVPRGRLSSVSPRKAPSRIRSAPPVIAGGLLEDAVLNNSSSIKKLSTDLSQLAVASSASGTGQSLSSMASGPSSTNPVASGPLATLTAQVLNLQERIASKAVTIEDTTFSTLKGTTQWVSANLPSSPEHALVCVDVVSLLHSIGREYPTTAETRELIYQNKRAGVSTMALTVASSFQTVLPRSTPRRPQKTRA